MMNRRGITLMEMVIMIAVGAALLPGLSRGLRSMVQQTVDSRNYMIAMNLAEMQLAIVNNTAYADSTLAETAQTADPAFPSFIPTLQRSAALFTSGAFNIRQITIRVRLNSVSGPQLIRIDTYLTNLVTFGDGI